jgi:hypothetical protein
MTNQTRTARVQFHVPNRFEQIGVPFDKAGMKTTLKEMAHPVTAAVEESRVGSVYVLDRLRHAAIPALHDKVVVVTHQTIGMADQSEATARGNEQIQELCAVRIIQKNDLLFVSARCDVKAGSRVV